MDANKYGRSAATSRELYLTCSTITTPCPQVLGYTMGKTLGSGKFAKVKAAWSPFERRMIAIKIINKRKVDQDDLDKFLPREISLLQKVSHPNIISLFQIVETEYHCFIALELAENGDLLDYLNSRGRVPEEESRFIFYQMCQAVAYCHSLGIAHRDIKLENVFFSKGMEVKIGDFGFAIESRSNLCSTPCGSFCYGAPEIVLSTAPEYNPQLADSWSMGVVLYAMVMGCLPFGDDNQVKNGLSNYHLLPLEGSHTQEFKDLVKSLLTVDITARPLIAEVATHTWMTALPSSRPSWEGPCGGKHTIKNCLPKFFHSLNPLDYGTSRVENPYPQFAPDDQPQTIEEAADPIESVVDWPPESAASSLLKQDNHPLAGATISVSNHSLKSGQVTSCGKEPSIISSNLQSIVRNISSAIEPISIAKLSVTASNIPVSASYPLMNTSTPLVCDGTVQISSSSPEVSVGPFRGSNSNTINQPISKKSIISTGNVIPAVLASNIKPFSASSSILSSKPFRSLPVSSTCPDFCAVPTLASKVSSELGNISTTAKDNANTCLSICDNNSASNSQANAVSTSGIINLPVSPSHTSTKAKSKDYARKISITSSITPISDTSPIHFSDLPTTSAPTEATAKQRQTRKHRIVLSIISAGRRLRNFIRRRVQRPRRSL